MEQGHHVEYAARLTSALVALGVEVHAVGSERFLEGVAAASPLDEGVTASYRHGKGVAAEVRKSRFLKAAATAVKRNRSQLVHLLFLDRFIVALATSRRAFGATAVAATLHWAYFSRHAPQHRANLPVRFLERTALGWLLRWDTRVMVHSAVLAEALRDEIGCSGFDFVPYPAPPSPKERIDRREARRRLGLPQSPRLLLAFGATRFDKGADIALAALRDLPADVHLLIAGRALDFDEAGLQQRAFEHGVSERLHLRLHFIPDEMVVNVFSACDAVLIPYRKVFSGQSGPLTIAAALGIPVVSADNLVLADTVRRFRLGEVFPAESVPDLASAVQRLLCNPPRPATAEFLREHDTSAFGQAVMASYLLADTRSEGGRG